MNQKRIITIDGPSGAGKSIVSRLVAKKLGLIYLDTGAMYRAVALKAQREGTDIKDGRALKRLCKKIDLSFSSKEDDDYDLYRISLTYSKEFKNQNYALEVLVKLGSRKDLGRPTITPEQGKKNLMGTI